MAADVSMSSPSPDSYIGSLISLTSKSEIRYEGILYIINTEESSIGLRNVRSFGTEGRKDGSQVPATDKIYEFILFRGSDIKDLQVKASPLAQTAALHNDPAIIQSHYHHPPTASPSLPANLPSLGSGTAPELASNTAQILQQPTVQGNFPTYPTIGSFSSWGTTPSPAPANVSGLVPMYWHGYYAPSGGFPHLQQPPLIRPAPGLTMPPMQQALQFQGMNASLSSGTPNFTEFPLFPSVSSSLSLGPTSLTSTVAPSQATSLTPEMAPSLVSNKIPINYLPTPIKSGKISLASSLTPSMETSAPLAQNILTAVSSRIGSAISVANLAEIGPKPPTVGSSCSNLAETSATFVTPDHLMQLTSSMLPSSESQEKSTNTTEIKPPKDTTKLPISERSVPELEAKTKVEAVAKEPLLPLPTPSYHKPSGAVSGTNQSSKARGRGRGNGYPRPVEKFNEEFDFTAMNEKFNKDEVWGQLGKSKAHSSTREGEDDEADDYDEETEFAESLDIKPVYVKDAFFDTLSRNTNDQTSNGRIKYSEQLKIDTETFGNFQRNRPAYGGRGLRGGRGRSSCSGSRSYGYSSRGRGYSGINRAS